MLHGYIQINQNLQLDAILLADGLALTASSEDEIQHSAHNLQIVANKYSMEINIEKTRIIAFFGGGRIPYQAKYVYKMN
jgi:hypothetical protein